MTTVRELNNVIIFENRFSIYGTIDDPYFLAKDVARLINHAKASELVSLVENDEKLMAIVSHSGQNREMWFLTEDGLYEVLLQSRKPIAKKLKKQVKKILKEIRLHGRYEVPQTYADALLLAFEQQKLIEQQKELIEEIRPKADYVDRILTSKSLVTITQIAKDYGISGRSMNRLLHKLDVQYKQSNQWLLYRKHQAKGYTHSETVVIEDTLGIEKIVMNTKWTQKGRLFLYDLLKTHGIFPVIEKEN